MNSKLEKISQKHGLTLIVLFGSYSTGKTHLKSDLDIAVLSGSEDVDKLKLIFDFGDIFEKEIDLIVITKDTDPVLLYEIFSHGKLLYEKKEGLFMDQYLRAWHIYQDTEKIRRWQEQYLHQTAERLKNNVTTSS